MGTISEKINIATLDFSLLPDASNNDGRIVRCNPLVAGQPYFFMISDGTYWRPLNGSALLYALPAEVVMTNDAAAQLVASIPIPAGMLVDYRSKLQTFLSVEKLGGTSDTLTMLQRLGTAGTVSDTILFNPALATTAITVGSTARASRITGTTVRKEGSAGTGVYNSLSASSTSARTNAITVGNMDTTTNYLTLWGDLTTGGGEYGVVGAFSVWLLG